MGSLPIHGEGPLALLIKLVSSLGGRKGAKVQSQMFVAVALFWFRFLMSSSPSFLQSKEKWSRRGPSPDGSTCIWRRFVTQPLFLTNPSILVAIGNARQASPQGSTVDCQPAEASTAFHHHFWTIRRT